MPERISAVPPTLQHYRLSIQSGRRGQEVITTKLITVAGQASLDAEIAKLGRGQRCVGWEIARLHRCSSCDKLGPWTDEWSWYGSYRQIDDGDEVVKSCSEACRVEAKRKGLVPRSASNLVDGPDYA